MAKVTFDKTLFLRTPDGKIAQLMNGDSEDKTWEVREIISSHHRRLDDIDPEKLVCEIHHLYTMTPDQRKEGATRYYERVAESLVK